jgi:hypothetical protein
VVKIDKIIENTMTRGNLDFEGGEKERLVPIMKEL